MGIFSHFFLILFNLLITNLICASELHYFANIGIIYALKIEAIFFFFRPTHPPFNLLPSYQVESI